MKTDWIASSTIEKKIEEKGAEEGPSAQAGSSKGKEVAEADTQSPELFEEEDAPKIIHAHLYSEEEMQVCLQRPNLCPDASDMIRVRFERTAQEPSKVFTKILIRRILDLNPVLFLQKHKIRNVHG